MDFTYCHTMFKSMSRRRLYGLLTLLIVLIVIVVYTIASVITTSKNIPPKFGFTFSKKYSEFLGQDWKKAYTTILDEQNFTHVRIPIYWSDVERDRDAYWFNDITFQIEEAEKRNVKSVVVLGMRQPRWPECYLPTWAETLNNEERAAEIQELIIQSVQALKRYASIEAWQVENEPLLGFFGICPEFTAQDLKNEVTLVRSLDSRPTIVTASGELSTWLLEARTGDILGSTLYRITGNKYFASMNSYWFLQPSFYRLKALAVGKDLQNYWIMELQAEPWIEGDVHEIALRDQFKTMNAKRLVEHIEFAKQVGSPRVYLWGVEWWLYVKENFGDESLWKVFQRKI